MLTKILDGIDHIRSRPEQERQSVGFSVAFLCTAVIAVVWLTTISFGGGTVAEQPSQQNAQQVTERYGLPESQTASAAQSDSIDAFSILKRDAQRALENGARIFGDIFSL